MRLTCFRLMAALAVCSVATALGGCGGGGGSDNTTPQQINHPPALTVVSPTASPVSLNVGQSSTMDIRVRADDPDGGDLNLVSTWDAGSVTPSSTKVKAGTETSLKFTAPNYNGRCNVTVTVSDGEASASKTVKIDVSGAGDPASQLKILSMEVSPGTVKLGQTASVTAGVQNPGGSTLTYTWKCEGGSITGSGSTATWTAPKVAGVYGIYLTVSDGVSSVRSGMTATAFGDTGGVLGQYFRTRRDRNYVLLDKEVFRRVDPAINFVWQDLAPDPRLPSEGYGARWTGFIKGEVAGTYVFRVHVDDGARMKIMDDSGQWVDVVPNDSDSWVDHVQGAWLPETLVPVQWQGGKWYPFQLEFFQGATNAYITLYWRVNGGPEEIVPQSAFKQPN